VWDSREREPAHGTSSGSLLFARSPMIRRCWRLRETTSAPQRLRFARRAFRATLFDKSLSANWLVAWHQDTALPLQQRIDVPGWGPWTTKAGVLHAIAPASALEEVIALRLHIDDSTSENGPLRVLPGTHADGVLSDARVTELANQIDAVECVVSAGGIIAMRPLIVHASSKARSAQPRRVIHIEYASSLGLGSGLQLAN
jgi:hypothetical protein